MKGANSTVTYNRIAVWLQRDNTLQPLLAAFASRRIDCIPLKGWALQRVYPQPEGRSMGDVDLLVRQDDFLPAAQLLQEEGFDLVEVFPAVDLAFLSIQLPQNWPPTLTFRSPQELELDLHREFLSNRWLTLLFTISMDAIWEAAIAAEQPVSFSHQLAAADMLGHLCLHIGTHAFHTSHGYRDIDLWVRREMRGEDWENFIARVQAWGSAVLSYWVLDFCRETLGTPVPDFVLEMLKPVRFKLAMAQVFKGKKNRTRPSLWQWILTERWGAMLRVVLGILFPERVYLKARYEGHLRIIQHWKRFAKLGFGD